MPRKKTRGASNHAAVAEKFDDLVMKRRVRRRRDGDGRGCDVGIGLVGRGLEKILDDLSPATKIRLLDHLRHHVDEAMRPILRAIEKTGNEYELDYIRDVGPNMLRTFIEFLEDESKK